MADAQIELRTGSVVVARNADQEQITALNKIPPVGFVHIGDVTVAVDLIATAYMLDEDDMPAEPKDVGRTYSDADLEAQGDF